MAQAISASGIMGVALEDTPGTYKAPTKFIPFNSESLKWTQETYWRRPIRNTPALDGAIPGDGHVEGDIEFDVTADVLSWLLHASRCTVKKTGSGPYTYVFTPSPAALPTKALSVSIKRNEEVFGYTGCSVVGYSLKIDGGILKCTANLIGFEEATQGPLVAVWPTSPVFGAGSYKLEIPTGTQVYDSDSFEFNVDDSGEAMNRIKNTRGAAFVKFGESNVTMSMERDFHNRTDYDGWKNLTAKSISLTAASGADSVKLVAPVAIADTYEVNLGSQGDLVRASATYNCVTDSTGKNYELTIVTSENIG